MNDRTENRPAARPWPPESCPDWCSLPAGEAGHPGAAAYSDRVHGAEEASINLSAKQPASYVALEIEQHFREVEPRILLTTPGAHLGLTLDEAEQLALTILATVAAGRTGGPIPPEVTR